MNELIELDILKWIAATDHQLDRRRTSALARAQWTKAIETEAQLELLGILRKAIVDAEINLMHPNANPTP